MKFLFSILLFPLSLIYRFLFLLDFNFTKKKDITDAKVISIGNLSVGGTGKTPFTIYLLENFQLYGDFNLTLLSRGYGGEKSSDGMLVEIDSNPKDCGDEPKLIKENLPDVNVIIGKNRFESYQKIFKPSNKRKFVFLDDGFQHHKLKRNYDFVLIDSSKLLGNGFLIPAGLLREPLSALNRANSLVFTKVNDVQEKNLQKLRNKIHKKFPKLKIYHMVFTPTELVNKNTTFKPEILKNKKIFAFCGIGNPDSFYSVIEKFNPIKLEKKSYPDHYPVPLKDIEEMNEKSSEYDFIICTEKDYVKFSESISFEKLFFLKMKTEVLEKEDLFNDLKNVLKF